MRFASSEDRLNPEPPPEADESTVGGYQAIHGRAATFEGSDGHAYSVAVETERSPEPQDPENPCAGYFVFLRWAHTGSAVLGHVETEDIVTAPSEEYAASRMGDISLTRAKEILEEAIAGRDDAD